MAEAFHTPDFSINILSVGKLTDAYGNRFTRDDATQPDISSCIIFHRDKNNVFSKATISEGLYVIKHKKLNSLIPQLGHHRSQNFPDKLRNAYNMTTFANSPVFWYQ